MVIDTINIAEWRFKKRAITNDPMKSVKHLRKIIYRAQFVKYRPFVTGSGVRSSWKSMQKISTIFLVSGLQNLALAMKCFAKNLMVMVITMIFMQMLNSWRLWYQRHR
jgi:hypothetical protein